MHREVGCLRRLVGPASLVDWRCYCSCSGLIPSVTKRSTLFVKELSFPQTTPTYDVFFNQTGLERVAIVGPVRWLWTADSSAKTRKKKGRRGLRPWPLRCLSQFLPERKDRLLRGRIFLRTFHRWGGLVFIAHVSPNWMVARILSHWMKHFLLLS